MKLVNSSEILKHALMLNYAVGAFNFSNVEVLKAILKGALNQNSPVILQCSTGALKYMDGKTIISVINSLDANLPVVLSLDHGKTFEDCKNAIDLGFTNVMIDGSALPFNENISLTQKVVNYAHKKGVTVEAELGVLAGMEEDTHAINHSFTDPNMVKEFVEKTNVDSLAIAIGTSHGTVKFKGKPSLNFEILSEIEKNIPNTPLVLHGASSIPKDMVSLAEKYGAKLTGANGVPENLLKIACTQHNICKVNVDSDLRIAFTAGIRESLFTHPENVDLRKYNKNGCNYVTRLVEHKIKNIFHSFNKA